ncbi:MAG: alkaline phosphatase D family protein [Opitutaceae bacterium]
MNIRRHDLPLYECHPYTLPAITRHRLINSTLTAGGALAASKVAASTTALPPVLGPLVGHTEATRTMIWLRPDTAGDYMLELAPAAGGEPRLLPARAAVENDLCLHWRVEDLNPATAYRYRILAGGKPIADDPAQKLVTAPPLEAPARVRFAISSCAKEDSGSRAVWNRIAAEDVDAVVLIGDTPYIDSAELETQTRRHREFAAVAEYQQLLRSRPCWWTWDDHDFATNGCCGLAPGKENSRLVFTRYRPQASYGDGTNGIYTSFRYGPVEVFLLDTRWFSMTEPSFANPGSPTLLGAAQWEWLQRGLRASTAPFKLLACGVIRDDKENTESDDWGTYLKERRVLERFIATHRIPGVVFMGGDIHPSRVLRYQTMDTVGYNLVQFIASPIHSSVIPSLNVYNPNLVRSAVEPHVFLLVDVDSTVSPARLQGTLVNSRGERVFSYALTLADLTAV